MEHWPATAVCVWLNLDGFQAVVVWQLMQLTAPAGMCVADFPVAVVPLWQLPQFVAAVKVLWSTFAPVQAVVLWHVPQLAVVARWLPGFPDAVLPLWQLEQFVAAVNRL